MIELGGKIAAAEHEGFSSSLMGKGTLIERFHVLAAELRLHGVNVEALASPVLAQQIALEKLEVNPDKLLLLETAREKIADKFSKDEELSVDDISLVPFTKKIKKQEFPYIAAILTNKNGLNMGTWTEIMAQDEATTSSYTIAVNGNYYDTRKAMDLDLHRAVSSLALASFSSSGQSLVSVDGNGDSVNTSTWYTGNIKNVQTHGVPCGDDEKVNPTLYLRNPNGRWTKRKLVFRPGIVIPA